MRNSILFLAAAAMAGCAVTGAPPPNPDAGTCNDSTLGSYIGQPYTDALGREMQQKAGAQSLRVVRHGEVITMEYNGNRLTVSLDQQGRVASARCG